MKLPFGFGKERGVPVEASYDPLTDNSALKTPLEALIPINVPKYNIVSRGITGPDIVRNGTEVVYKRLTNLSSEEAQILKLKDGVKIRNQY